jgi:hypothetical protein
MVPTIQDVFKVIHRVIDRNFDVLEVDFEREFGFQTYLYQNVNRRSSNVECSIEITSMYLFFDQKYDQHLKYRVATVEISYPLSDFDMFFVTQSIHLWSLH